MGINAIILAEAPEPLTLAKAREWTRKLRRAVPIGLYVSRKDDDSDEEAEAEGRLVRAVGLVVRHPTGASEPWITMYDAEWSAMAYNQDLRIRVPRYTAPDWRCVVEVDTWLRSHPRGDAVFICAIAAAAEALIGPVWYGTDASESVFRFPLAARERMLAEKWEDAFIGVEERDDSPPCPNCGGPVFIMDDAECLACGRRRDGTFSNEDTSWRDDHFVLPKLEKLDRGNRSAWFRALGKRIRETGFAAAVADELETYKEPHETDTK